MNYVFYFDETFHDKRITIKPDGTINSLLEDKNNCYIGVFWGCKQEMLREVIKSLTTFEKNYMSTGMVLKGLLTGCMSLDIKIGQVITGTLPRFNLY